MNDSRRRLSVGVRLLVLPLLLTALTVLAGAQGRVVGKVTDGKGGPVEGVKITITTSALTKFKLELTSDKNGKWQTILNDATLVYTYLFEKPGHMSVKIDKKVPVASTGEPLDVELLTQDQAISKGVVKVVEDPFTKAYNEAVDKLKEEDLASAWANAQEALVLGPDKAVAWKLGATIASKQKKWDKAVEMGEKSLALDPENTDLYGLLIEAYRAKGSKTKVAEYEKKFAAANPDKPEVLYNQAVELYNKGAAKAAEPILKQILVANPDYVNAHYLIGMCYVNLGKVPELRKHFKEYLRLDPKGKEAGTAKDMLDAFK
ncbi:MAG TPA: tetratricopeptide repeat protein [Thermoanaerobaculia bacterium]